MYFTPCNNWGLNKLLHLQGMHNNSVAISFGLWQTLLRRLGGRTSSPDMLLSLLSNLFVWMWFEINREWMVSCAHGTIWPWRHMPMVPYTHGAIYPCAHGAIFPCSVCIQCKSIVGGFTFTTNWSFNQSIKIYIAPLKDPYSEALPTQAKRKRTVHECKEDSRNPQRVLLFCAL